MNEKKIGIDETMDAINFAEKIVTKLAAAKADDGKIDSGEIASALISVTPAGIAAFVGSGKIDDELKDLDDEERAKIISSSLAVIKQLVGMFVELEKE